jgi:hypothetical protein
LVLGISFIVRHRKKTISAMKRIGNHVRISGSTRSHHDTVSTGILVGTAVPVGVGVGVGTTCMTTQYRGRHAGYQGVWTLV